MKVEFEASRCGEVSRTELAHNLMIAWFCIEGHASAIDPEYRDAVANKLRWLIDNLRNDDYTLIIPSPNQKVRYK